MFDSYCILISILTLITFLFVTLQSFYKNKADSTLKDSTKITVVITLSFMLFCSVPCVFFHLQDLQFRRMEVMLSSRVLRTAQ